MDNSVLNIENQVQYVEKLSFETVKSSKTKNQVHSSQ